jgi:hypothetical protein
MPLRCLDRHVERRTRRYIYLAKNEPYSLKYDINVNKKIKSIETK